MADIGIFNSGEFTVSSLTAKVNEIEFVPGQVSDSGVFEEDSVSTTTVEVESEGGQLTLVEPSPRGGTGETVGNTKRSMRSFIVPHYQRDDAVKADEIQNVRAFGTTSELEQIEDRVQKKSARHTRALDATLEHSRIGAIKGIVTTRDGKVLHNLYNEFDVATPDPIYFDLVTSGSKPRQVCFDVIEKTEEQLDGMPYDRLHAYCGKDFWKDLVEHKAVKETYLNTVQAAELRGDIHGANKFEFGGIVFERYRTGPRAKASAGTAFIEDGEARFVPVGVPELFITRFAPADYMETVNTPGLPRYSQVVMMPNKKGVELEVQSNFINLCTRPSVLFQGLRTAA